MVRGREWDMFSDKNVVLLGKIMPTEFKDAKAAHLAVCQTLGFVGLTKTVALTKKLTLKHSPFTAATVVLAER